MTNFLIDLSIFAGLAAILLWIFYEPAPSGRRRHSGPRH